MPGVSVPASPRAVTFRAGCDLLVVPTHQQGLLSASALRDLGHPVEDVVVKRHGRVRHPLPTLALVAAGDHGTPGFGLNVGDGQLVSHQIRRIAELLLDERKMRTDLSFDPLEQSTGGIADSSQIQLQQEGCHERAFGIVQPIPMTLESRRAARGDQRAVAVMFDEVLENHRGLRDDTIAVANDW